MCSSLGMGWAGVGWCCSHLASAWNTHACGICMKVCRLQGAFRGLGDTQTPLYATLLCNGLNVILNYTLLFVLHWGVAGSAWATVGSEV